jgi:hypothetical protein
MAEDEEPGFRAAVTSFEFLVLPTRHAVTAAVTFALFA